MRKVCGRGGKCLQTTTIRMAVPRCNPDPAEDSDVVARLTRNTIRFFVYVAAKCYQYQVRIIRIS